MYIYIYSHMIFPLIIIDNHYSIPLYYSHIIQDTHSNINLFSHIPHSKNGGFPKTPRCAFCCWQNPTFFHVKTPFSPSWTRLLLRRTGTSAPAPPPAATPWWGSQPNVDRHGMELINVGFISCATQGTDSRLHELRETNNDFFCSDWGENQQVV